VSSNGGTVGHLLSSGGDVGILFSGTCGIMGILLSGICGIMGTALSVWVTTLNLPHFTAVVVIGLSLVPEFQEASDDTEENKC
jgi:hypothetical protein